MISVKVQRRGGVFVRVLIVAALVTVVAELLWMKRSLPANAATSNGRNVKGSEFMPTPMPPVMQTIPLPGQNPGQAPVPAPANPAPLAKTEIDGHPVVTFDQLTGFTCEVPYPDEVADFAAEAKKITATFPREVLDLDGTKAAIQGFVIPIRFEAERLKVFILVRNQLFCCYGAAPKINEWVLVTMAGDLTAPVYIDKPIIVLGTLSTGVLLQDEEVVSVYRMSATEVRLSK